MTQHIFWMNQMQHLLMEGSELQDIQDIQTDKPNTSSSPESCQGWVQAWKVLWLRLEKDLKKCFCLNVHIVCEVTSLYGCCVYRKWWISITLPTKLCLWLQLSCTGPLFLGGWDGLLFVYEGVRHSRSSVNLTARLIHPVMSALWISRGFLFRYCTAPLP